MHKIALTAFLILLPVFAQADVGQKNARLVNDAALQKAGCTSGDGHTVQHQHCRSVAEIDLTGTFHTTGRTVLEITQAESAESEPDDIPSLSYCFIQRDKTRCEYGDDPNEFEDFSIIHLLAGYPVLLAHLSEVGLAGCGHLYNYVWAYDPSGDEFKRIWDREVDCHTALRFETKGPLAGDVIAIDDNATGRFPWPYGVEVHKFVPPDRLEKILYFVGKAGQGGKYVSGPNRAIDIDMPEILRRLNISR